MAKSAKTLNDPEFFIDKNRQRLNNLILLLNNHSKHALDIHQNEISKRAALLESLSPLKVLSRGYSIATLNGNAVTSADMLKDGDAIQLKFQHGAANAVVTSTEKG